MMWSRAGVRVRYVAAGANVDRSKNLRGDLQPQTADEVATVGLSGGNVITHVGSGAGKVCASVI